jgi:protein tyrosine/serine phosphatase
LELIALLRDMPKPMLVHCKSGADRTGLAVTIYLHVIKGLPLTEARRALSWRYAHFSWGKAGIVSRMLDAYEADNRATGIGFEEWVETRYDPAAITGGVSPSRD